jgi:phosphomevalonate kinase
MKTLIIISGKRSCGKDTVASLIKTFYEKQNKTIKILPVAYATKVGYCQKFNLDLERMVNDYEFKEQHRQGLCDYFYASEDFDWYADYVIEQIMKVESDVYIIPDLRLKSHLVKFEKLFEFLKDFNKLIVRINSTEESRCSRGWVSKTCDLDFTEIDLDNYKFDNVINNDSTIDDLDKKIIELLVINKC